MIETISFDNETELKHYALGLIKEGATYRQIVEKKFYVAGKRQRLNISKVSRWTKGVREVANDVTTGTRTGEIASAAFQHFRKGESPSDVVIALKLPPAMILDLYQQWAEMNGCLVFSAYARSLVENENLIDGQSDLDSAIQRLVQDRIKLRAFHYHCNKCGGLIQASDVEWNWIRQNGHLSTWGHTACPQHTPNEARDLDEVRALLRKVHMLEKRQDNS